VGILVTHTLWPHLILCAASNRNLQYGHDFFSQPKF
jgi:hypothetical protein